MLRLPTIGSPLDTDEGISFRFFTFSSWDELFLDYWTTNKHTLFSALSRLTIGMFGENEIAVRLPALLAGIFAVPLIYYLSFLLLNSEAASIASSLLLTLSFPHLMYSQIGRGYTMTVFLAMTMVLVVLKLIYNKNVWLWRFLLIIFGFCMVLTLPTNALFIASAAIFYLIAVWKNDKKFRGFLEQKVLLDLISFLIMFGLIIGYFYIIYPQMSFLKEIVKGLNISLQNFVEIFLYMVSPWGAWLYLFFIFGLLSLKSEGKHLQFLSLFITPVILILISGLMSYIRTYIYFLPFVLILVAFGAVQILFYAQKVLSKNVLYVLIVFFCISISVQPALSLKDHYSGRAQRNRATIDEAKQIRSFVLEKIPRHHLIILPDGNDSVLHHYLHNEIFDEMLKIINGEQLDKIIFISHKSIQPKDFPLKQYYPGRSILLQDKLFKLENEIGDFRIYNFAMKISRFIPSVFDPDYERKIALKGGEGITIENITTPRLTGRQALAIYNRSGNNAIIASRLQRKFDIEINEAYLLFIYAKGYQQNSKAMLIAPDWPKAIASLNPYIGEYFTSGNSKFNWSMVYLLYPLKKGRINLQEVFHLTDGTFIFDGFQSFLLHSKKITSD